MPDWTPFLIESPNNPKQPLRSWKTPEGLEDRMRIAAFAEEQAIHAFSWAAVNFTDVPEELTDAWRAQIPEERLHRDLIVKRMEELGCTIDARPVSDRLYNSLLECRTGREFCLQIVAEEHRGLLSALKLVDIVAPRDPATAAIFQRIADDESAHVDLAKRFFNWSP